MLLATLMLLQFGALDEAPKSRQHVRYTPEQQVITAGKRGVLELSFAVELGYHVNSHTPKSEMLVPTRVELVQDASVKVGVVDYPAGKPYRLALDPDEVLDVYSSDFVVRVPVVAAAGEHELRGTLLYQACDQAACYPPKHLPLSVIFIAR